MNKRQERRLVCEERIIETLGQLQLVELQACREAVGRIVLHLGDLDSSWDHGLDRGKVGLIHLLVEFDELHI